MANLRSDNSSNWNQVTPSQYPWEQEALDYIKGKLPAGEIYGAWANFTFMTTTGRSYEVDALVMTPKGLFLVEIKSRPGRINGDQGTWKWYQDGGKVVQGDNPLPLANEKAKALKGMLERTKAAKAVAGKRRVPWLDEIIFASHPSNRLQLPAEFANKVGVAQHAIDAADDAGPELWQLVSHIPSSEFQRGGRKIDRPTAKLIREALNEIGIRPSNRTVTFGDFRLDKLVASGPGYQDYLAINPSIGSRRRVRVYASTEQVTTAEQAAIERAARREAKILESVQHPGIVRAMDFQLHERGPTVIYEWVDDAVRLDRYLAEHGDSLDLQDRMRLIRLIAEAVHYAHRRGIVHRSLNPQSILIDTSDPGEPQPKIIDWQVAFDLGADTNLTAGLTTHIGQFVDEPAQCYMAPEAISATADTGQQVDVFGVGAVAYHVLTGTPPASTPLELADRVRGSGLDLAGQLDGVTEKLRETVLYATTGDLSVRWAGMDDLLDELAKVERELADDDQVTEDLVDPAVAGPTDLISPDLMVVQRLGSGATAHALLVETSDDERMVIKVARSSEHDERIRREAALLHNLNHQGIAQLRRQLDVQSRAAFLMTFAGEETLGARLRREGRIAADFLERWGTDLLQTVAYLEQVKVAHRDIKPDNIGVWEQPGSRKRHLVLFDFSLSGADATNIRAGTPPYLDPFLIDSGRRSWDQHAERFAAAMTLHEMAAGQLPSWGDGISDPAQLDVEVTIDEDRFDNSVAAGLGDFFRTALARSATARYDTAEEMLAAWRAIFENAGTALTSEHPDILEPAEAAATAQLTDPLAALNLAPRVVDLFARLGADTVADVLALDPSQLTTLSGTGNQVRRDARALLKELANRFPDDRASSTATVDEDDDTLVRSVDLLAQRVVPDSRKTEHDQTVTIRALLGLHVEPNNDNESWWLQHEQIADVTGLPLDDVRGRIEKATRYWSTRRAITALREDIAHLLSLSSGVMTVDELARAVLAHRGSAQSSSRRLAEARAITRAAVETELSLKEPRFQLRRAPGAPPVIALDATADGGAEPLDVASWAHTLGSEVDNFLTDDDVVARADAVDQLRLVTAPDGMMPLSDARLLSLAAAASSTGALSARAELYRRNLEPRRALELARGALLVTHGGLAPDDVASRVRSRFPAAQELPPRPQLDQLLAEAQVDLAWSEQTERYTSPTMTATGTSSITSIHTSYEPDRVATGVDEFTQRLDRSRTDGGFLCLKVQPQRYLAALDALAFHLETAPLDLSGRLLAHMHLFAEEKGIRWDNVRSVDAAGSDSRDWAKLRIVASGAAERLEDELRSREGLLLAHAPGLLIRYDVHGLIERLRDGAGTAGSPLTTFLLVIPQDTPDQVPSIDSTPIPVIGPAHHAAIPPAWIGARPAPPDLTGASS